MLASLLQTKRLVLRPATLEMATAELNDRVQLGRLLDAEIPVGWPPQLYDLDARRWSARSLENDPDAPAACYMLLKRDPQRPLLIGVGGFKGRPVNGVAEIGYSILPEWQGRGFGTEAVRVLTQFAFGNLQVRIVCAHTLLELIPSRRVLEKNGFVLRGAPEEEGTIRYEITAAEWRRGWQERPEQ